MFGRATRSRPPPTAELVPSQGRHRRGAEGAKGRGSPPSSRGSTRRRWPSTVSFPPPIQPSPKTRFEMLLGVKEHEMHHRAQLMLDPAPARQVPPLTRARQRSSRRRRRVSVGASAAAFRGVHRSTCKAPRSRKRRRGCRRVPVPRRLFVGVGELDERRLAPRAAEERHPGGQRAARIAHRDVDRRPPGRRRKHLAVVAVPAC